MIVMDRLRIWGDSEVEDLGAGDFLDSEGWRIFLSHFSEEGDHHEDERSERISRFDCRYPFSTRSEEGIVRSSSDGRGSARAVTDREPRILTRSRPVRAVMDQDKSRNESRPYSE